MKLTRRVDFRPDTTLVQTLKVERSRKFLNNRFNDVSDRMLSTFVQVDDYLLECDVVGVPIGEHPIFCALHLLHEGSNLVPKILGLDQQVGNYEERHLVISLTTLGSQHLQANYCSKL